MEDSMADDVIKRLLGAKNGKTTKQVQLTEAEIKHLCSTAKQIFLSQPNLLELKAPIKICDLLNETSVPQTPLFTSQVNTPRAPMFSFQKIDDTGVEENSPEAAREARRRWSVLEDGALVSAWLNTSKDAIVGNEQKAGAFWKRVAAYFAASPAVKNLQKREWNNCQERWGKINECVLKFCGCYDQAQCQSSSGQSEDDMFQMAYKLYFQDQRANFTLEHCWRMLRHDQKWCSLVSQKRKSQSKRARLDESGANSSPSNKDCQMEDQTMERPMGVKAAKAKGKKSGMPTTEERDANVKRLESVWEIRKEDLAVKERLSKQKLLYSLLGKPEPLSEIDIYLKNKLISEMYP